MPDFRFTVEDAFGTADPRLWRGVVSATLRGDFGPLPATGKSPTSLITEIFRIADVQIVEVWVYLDTRAYTAVRHSAGPREERRTVHQHRRRPYLNPPISYFQPYVGITRSLENVGCARTRPVNGKRIRIPRYGFWSSAGRGAGLIGRLEQSRVSCGLLLRQRSRKRATLWVTFLVNISRRAGPRREQTCSAVRRGSIRRRLPAAYPRRRNCSAGIRGLPDSST
jgi:hypothetical protein